jgi:hypothetical protein
MASRVCVHIATIASISLIAGGATLGGCSSGHSASDPSAATGSNATAQNGATPMISGSPVKSVPAGSLYSFRPTVTAPSSATITFTITNQPGWATFDAASGALTGTPTTANVGSTAPDSDQRQRRGHERQPASLFNYR